MRIIDKYRLNLEYRTKKFREAIYCNQKQVIEKSK